MKHLSSSPTSHFISSAVHYPSTPTQWTQTIDNPSTVATPFTYKLNHRVFHSFVNPLTSSWLLRRTPLCTSPLRLSPVLRWGPPFIATPVGHESRECALFYLRVSPNIVVTGAIDHFHFILPSSADLQYNTRKISWSAVDVVGLRWEWGYVWRCFWLLLLVDCLAECPRNSSFTPRW